jgi:translation elongation factor EF-G
MRIEVVTPDEYMGAVNGDLMRRRGQLKRRSRARAARR